MKIRALKVMGMVCNLITNKLHLIYLKKKDFIWFFTNYGDNLKLKILIMIYFEFFN